MTKMMSSAQLTMQKLRKITKLKTLRKVETNITQTNSVNTLVQIA